MNDRLHPDDPAEIDPTETDDLLRRRLRTVPAPGGADPRLEELRPRFGRARRRRQAATAALGTAAALVVVGLAVSIGGGDGARVDVPAGPGSSTTRPPVTTTTSEVPTASTVVVPPSTPTTTAPAGAPGTTPRTPASTTTRPPGTTSRPVSSSTVDPTPQEVTTPTAGGRVVVLHDSTTVTLVRTEPAAGWSVAETRTEPDRVEVRFRRDGSSEESKVVARIDGGTFRVETS